MIEPVNIEAIDMLIQSITLNSRIIKLRKGKGNMNFTDYFQAHIYL
jgi:hypothetical protein